MEDQKKLDNLIIELRENRSELKKMVIGLEEIKVKVDKLLPEQLTARSAQFFEEKVKATTNLFKTILDVRQEISKNIKDEFELSRKIEKADSDNQMDSESINKLLSMLDSNMINGMVNSSNNFENEEDLDLVESEK